MAWGWAVVLWGGVNDLPLASMVKDGESVASNSIGVTRTILSSLT